MTQTAADEPSRRDRVPFIVVGLAVLVVLVTLIWQYVDDGNDRSGSPTTPAAKTCETAVRNALPFPKSAEFGASSVQYDSGDAVVTGYVDARNSSGQAQSASYRCTVRGGESTPYSIVYSPRPIH